METTTCVRGTDPPVSTGAALWTVLLPGRLERRAKAAASLPAWLTPLFVVCMLPLLAEVAFFTGQVLDEYSSVTSGFRYEVDPSTGGWQGVGTGQPTYGKFMRAAWKYLKPAIIPHALRGSGPIISLGICALVLVLLEILNLFALVPFGASFGERFFHVEPRTRNILFSLGSLWLLQTVVVWAVICVFAGAMAGEWLFWNREPGRADLLFMSVFGVAGCLFLLQVWLARVIRACSRLAAEPGQMPAARCGYCGYFLEGLADGKGCPECGQADPAEPDRLRGPTVWVRRSEVGWLKGLTQPVVQVLVTPGRLFGRMRVLPDARDSRRFLVAAIWVGLVPWLIALPGMALGFVGHGPINARTLQEAFRLASQICPMFVLFSSLAGLVIFCLLNTLVGLLVSRARQEPAWAIGANAGCYLAGLFPWIIAAQGLWINVFYGVVGYQGMEAYSRELENMTRIEWPILFVLILLIPTMLGIGLAIRTAVVCYRYVRYACR